MPSFLPGYPGEVGDHLLPCPVQLTDCRELGGKSTGTGGPAPLTMPTVSEYPSGTGPSPRDATESNVIEHGGHAAWPAQVRSALRKLGPGLVTGAADDDPSGIATYSPGGGAVRLRDAVDHAV